MKSYKPSCSSLWKALLADSFPLFRYSKICSINTLRAKVNDYERTK